MAEIKLVKKVTVKEGKSYSIIVTHGDLDGVVSASLISEGLKSAFMTNHIIMSSLDPTAKMTEDLILKASENVEKFSGIVYIVDRDIYNPEFKDIYPIQHTHWIDHHKSSIEKYLSNRDAYNEVEEYLTSNPSESAATLAYELMLDLFSYQNIDIDERTKSRLSRWAELTALWDTFTWKKDPNSDDSKIAKKLAFASYTLTPAMLYEFAISEFVMNPQLRFAADIYKNKFTDACNSALMNGRVCNMKGYEFTVLTDVEPEFISMVADYCFDKYKSTDVVLCIGNGLVSTRVRQESDFDASNLMKQLGAKFGFSGGGHVKAAGCKYKEASVNSAEDRQNILDTIRGILG